MFRDRTNPVALVFALPLALAIAACGATDAESQGEGATTLVSAPACTLDGSRGSETVSIDTTKIDKPTAFIFWSTKCPVCRDFEDYAKEVRTKAGDDVNLVYIYSNKNESDAEKTEYHANSGLGGTFVLDDSDPKAAVQFKVRKTPEIFLFDGKGQPVYHGAFSNDQASMTPEKPYFLDAVAAMKEGKPAPVAKGETFG